MKLPSEEELAKLPRWAGVAYAARCAQRVQPLFKRFWPKAPHKHVDAIECAITAARSRAASPESEDEIDLQLSAFAAEDAARAAHADAAARAANAARAAYVAADVAWSFVHADAARAAGRAALPTRNHVAEAAFYAYRAADHPYEADAETDNPGSARSARSVRTAHAIRRDFDLLKAAAEREHWTDGTPVPVEFFGPLWPDGAPDGWPEEESNSSYEHPVPNEEEVRSLPRWAQVAYGARCARRVLPLLMTGWRDGPAESRDWIARAVELAERTASLGSTREIAAFHGDEWRAATRHIASGEASGAGDDVAQSAYAAEAAIDAAFVAEEAYTPSPRVRSFQSAYVAGNASANAAAAAVGVEAYGCHRANAAIRSDFNLLRRAAAHLHWTDDTPVPPEFFGPLWPDGEPEGWPEDASAKGEIAGPISVYIDPIAYSPDEAGELLAILSDIYESVSGDRLVIDGTGQATVHVDEPVYPGGGR